VTAGRRGPGVELRGGFIEGMGQSVNVLDPFLITQNSAARFRAGFNPMDRVLQQNPGSIDEAALIADSLIIQSTRGDPHWTLSARNLVKALILVQSFALPVGHEQRSLIGVRRLLMAPDLTAKLKAFVAMDVRSDAWAIAREAVGAYLVTPDNERGSILSSARTQTEFLDAPAMANVLTKSDFTFESLKNPNTPGSVYLCIPATKLATHGRWLRLMINCGLEAMEREKARPRDQVLFLLDEFAAMGRMDRIEMAVGLMAGYGVKLWPILQNLGQLKALYKDNWETFLGNSGIVQAFGNSDLTTCEYLSKRLGQITIATATAQNVSLNQQIAGQTGINTARINAPLMQPDEIERYFASHNNNQLVIQSGQRPLQLDRIAYYEHKAFRHLHEPDPSHE